MEGKLDLSSQCNMAARGANAILKAVQSSILPGQGRNTEE